MGILCKDLREVVVRPALKKIGRWSEAAENLLLGTAAQESQMGRYLRQINGPALGIYQCEPATHEDIFDNYLIYHGELLGAVTKLTVLHLPRTQQLAWNLMYATAIARIHYLRIKEPLPKADDIVSLGCYWKNHYNTHLGKGTVEEYVKSYTAMVV